VARRRRRTSESGQTASIATAARPRRDWAGLSPRPAVKWKPLVAAALIVAAIAAAYSNSLDCALVYDDLPAIRENSTIRQLWPIWPALSPPNNGGTVSGRPLVNLSLAINYALAGGDSVRGYHVTNIIIHALAALVLFGVVRRTLLLGIRDGGLGIRGSGDSRTSAPPHALTPSPRHCLWLAWSVALIWGLHPLQTQSVTYIVQRAESLVSLFYLLTLYCVIRGAECDVPRRASVPRHAPPAPNPVFWYAGAVLACLLGMATKEVMVTAPLVVLLYDWTFLADSARDIVRRRGSLYLGLAMTWAVAAALVWSTYVAANQCERPSVWEYAQTQPGVILYYLRLCFWPHPLCFDYAWQVPERLIAVVLPALAIAAMLAVGAWGLWRKRAWGCLTICFFITLSPSSSIVPLGQGAVEHRMYLPLAALVAVAVGGAWFLGNWLLVGNRGLQSGEGSGFRVQGSGVEKTSRAAIGWLGTAIVLAICMLLGRLTFLRNKDYRDAWTLWSDTLAKAPKNPFALNDVGYFLFERRGPGDVERAIQHYHAALEAKPNYDRALYNLGIALTSQGNTSEAIRCYEQVLKVRPGHAKAHHNLAALSLRQGRVEAAIEHYRAAIACDSQLADSYADLGWLLTTRDKTDEAVVLLQQALRINPRMARAHDSLGVALAAKGQIEQALGCFRGAITVDPGHLGARQHLAETLTACGQVGEAIEHYQQAAQLAAAQGQPAVAEEMQSKIRQIRAAQSSGNPRP
jgi:protein O-mannosyl-transferase